MGLTQDLIDAKIAGLKQSGATDDAISKAQVTLETQTELEVEAIVKFLTNVNFTITHLKAPIIVENAKIPPQPVNIELQTLIGDKAPILSAFVTIPLAPLASAAIALLIIFIPPIPVCTINDLFGSGPSNSTFPW